MKNGYDDLERQERGKLCRSLIRKGPKATAQEQDEITVLLLMAQSMTETEARDEMRRRQWQSRCLRRRTL